MAEPWFDANSWAWLPGTLLGTFAGLWGALTGTLAPQGKARHLVLGLGWLLLGVSLVLLAAGLTALVSGQPHDVWNSLGLPGLIGAVVIASLFPVINKRYREAEQRESRTEEKN
jgi:uncharacterized membrane protein